MILVAAVAGLFVLAALVPLAHRRWPRLACALAVAGSTAVFAAVLARLGAIAADEVVTASLPWARTLGVDVALRLDGLAAVFALLITGIGALVLGYAPVYLDGAPRAGRLLGLLLAFEASMLGLVLADDTITLFVFWELTSFASFFLVAFDASSELARTRARQALVITAGGGLALLVGLLLLAGAASGGISVALSSLADAPLRAHPHYTAIVVLIALGAFTKSAQLPFHFWLPGAMVAPSPVSAYLHSATMVKAGIYLLARLHPSLGGTALWIGLLASVGAATFVAGAVLATLQRDVKLVLAYATISTLGGLTLLLGIGTVAAIGGAVVLLVAHACYKAALFLVAGNLDHHRGTRDPFAPPGPRRDLPITATAAAIAAASMAGIPPLLGFIAKDAVLAATLEGHAAVLVTIAAVLAGAGLVAAAWIAAVAPFLRGRGRPWARTDVARAMWVPPLVLALASLVLGVVPWVIGESLVGPAVTAIAGRPEPYEVALWPGLGGAHGLAFGLGVASLLVGAALARVAWRGRDRITALRARLAWLDGARLHEAALDATIRGAAWLARTVQHGRLPAYTRTVLVVLVLAVALPLGAWPELGGPWPRATLGTYELPLLVLATSSAIAAAVFRDRLSAIAALAALGLAVTFLFALFSGPDLAITQLTVETMMVILLVLVFRRLPPSATRGRATARARRLLVSVAGGAAVAALLLLATSTAGFSRDASAGQLELAVAEESPNVVNGILVNFRALDTLGEITVLAIAGLGVVALAGLTVRRRRR